MAKYTIFGSISLSPDGFFPVGIEIDSIDNGDNGRDYWFTIGGEARFVRVYWNEQSLISEIGLYTTSW